MLVWGKSRKTGDQLKKNGEMNYAILTKDNKFRIKGPGCPDHYERSKEAHLNPDSHQYGDVLVSTKRVYNSFSIDLQIFFKAWKWKPEYTLKGIVYLRWLFFRILIEKNYEEVPGILLEDHLCGIN